MQLDSYKNRTFTIKEKLQRIEDFAHEIKMENAAHQIHSILGRMMGDAFHLVIVGEFSRVKSTFVNALLGKKILPASKNPTTAIISKIVYGDAPDYRIYYKNEACFNTVQFRLTDNRSRFSYNFICSVHY